GAGVTNEQFYLWNGGITKQEAKSDVHLKRTHTSKAPIIDYTKDADSLAQAKKDMQEITMAVKTGKMDTTGSIESVYYYIMQQGTGDFVAVTDTVTVHYKGSLLTDGSIFDQTKDNPATFPLR
ncbi:FKBP-type peptidyl-prolyl cis-trans isomerase, partial [Parvimonas sp. D4]